MIFKSMLYAFVPFLLLSCTQAKKNGSSKKTTVSNTIDYVYGTYEGVLEDENSTSCYMLLALDSIGNYELYEKEIGTIGSSFYRGKVTTHLHNEVLNLQLREGLEMAMDGDILKNGKVKLRLTSREQSINPAYYNFIMKEDCTGSNYVVTIYTEDGIEYADFEFKGKMHKLKINNDNSQEIEYASSTGYLRWNIIDPAPLANYPLLFYDGRYFYRFTLLSPTNLFYKAKNESTPIDNLDVLYCNPEKERSFVRIISTNPDYCYELQQTEASAKTGFYESKMIKWYTNTNNEASLNFDGNTYVYVDPLQ